MGDRSWCHVSGDDRVASSFRGVMEQVEERLKQNVESWVKAALESSLGQIGTVGALSVEAFMDKLKDAFAAATSGSSARSVLDSLPSTSGVPAPECASVAAGPVAGGSTSGSRVPSAFGDSVSTAIVQEPAGLAPVEGKPGNYFQDHV